MKLVVAPLALAELHDAAAFYTLKASVELGAVAGIRKWLEQHGVEP